MLYLAGINGLHLTEFAALCSSFMRKTWLANLLHEQRPDFGITNLVLLEHS